MTDSYPADWNPRSEEVLQDQKTAYDRMREHCPVAYSEFMRWSLFRHADVMRVLTDHETFSNAVSSHLSVPNGMDPPLMSNRRITTKEVTLGGRRIPAGEQITILWGPANRDERVFGDPDAFCPETNAADNLLYGAGIHACPGAPLARMELRILLEELLAQTSHLEIPVDAEPERAVFPTGGFRYLPMQVYRYDNSVHHPLEENHREHSDPTQMYP